nr:MAG TPA: hypothetical protein [Caudoviricetes sp.]DAX87029.1 MAG TPA: hypothetical protein [Caudoviricetes sp.]
MPNERSKKGIYTILGLCGYSIRRAIKSKNQKKHI